MSYAASNFAVTVSIVRRRRLRYLLISTLFAVGIATVATSVVVPLVLLLKLNDSQLNRWSEIGQALSPVGILFSGVAFVGVIVALLIQQRELQNQHDEIAIAREEQSRASEVVIRQLHTDLVKMAIEDPELLRVWPDLVPGVAESKRDHYCNLILNLQKVAYETHTIELAELRGALRNLMGSADIYAFWKKARTARVTVTSGDVGEDSFTQEVDRAFDAIDPPPRPRQLSGVARSALRKRGQRRLWSPVAAVVQQFEYVAQLLDGLGREARTLPGDVVSHFEAAHRCVLNQATTVGVRRLASIGHGAASAHSYAAVFVSALTSTLSTTSLVASWVRRRREGYCRK